MVIQKRGIAIVYTRVPAIATPLSPFFFVIFWPHRNRISLVGHRRGARRLVSPGLHGIESINIYGGMFYNEDRPRPRMFRFFRVRRRFFAISEPQNDNRWLGAMMVPECAAVTDVLMH